MATRPILYQVIKTEHGTNHAEILLHASFDLDEAEAYFDNYVENEQTDGETIYLYERAEIDRKYKFMPIPMGQTSVLDD